MSEPDLVSKIFQGGYPAIIAVLGVVIVYLHRENKELRLQIRLLTEKYATDMKAGSDKYIEDIKTMYEQQVAREKEMSVLGENIVRAVESMGDQALGREREAETPHKEPRKR